MLTKPKKLTDEEILAQLCTTWRYDRPTVLAFYDFGKLLDRVECALCQLRGLRRLDTLPEGAQRLLLRRNKVRAALSEVNGTEAQIRADLVSIKTNFPPDNTLP